MIIHMTKRGREPLGHSLGLAFPLGLLYAVLAATLFHFYSVSAPDYVATGLLTKAELPWMFAIADALQGAPRTWAVAAGVSVLAPLLPFVALRRAGRTRASALFAAATILLLLVVFLYSRGVLSRAARRPAPPPGYVRTHVASTALFYNVSRPGVGDQAGSSRRCV